MSDTKSDKKMQHGEFCWNELMTPDPKKAKEFYGSLLGWTAEDNVMEHGTYTMFKQGDKFISGGMMQTPKGQEQQIPPHWMSYINVDDLEATVAKAKTLGATIRVPITAAGTYGHFAIITDPTGANVGYGNPPAIVKR